MRWSLLTLTVLFGVCQQSLALFDVIIDDSEAEFTTWNDFLQTGIGNDSYGNSYHYVEDWALLDGEPNALSAIARYRLPPGVDFPSGERIYNIYAWMPDVNWRWHVFDVNADGTGGYPFQDISWEGEFGTNTQWLAADPGSSFDTELGGRWIQLGPGPHSDSNADDGYGVYINPEVEFAEEPSIYIKYQPFYDGLIAFDAIRIIEVPPDAVAGDFNGDGTVNIADYTVWRNNLGAATDDPINNNGDNVPGVTAGDYQVWKDQFGQLSTAVGSSLTIDGSTSVPESSSVLLAACACSLILGVRRRVGK